MAKLVRYRVEIVVEDDTIITQDQVKQIKGYLEDSVDFSITNNVRSASVQCMKIEENVDEGKIH